MKKRGFIRRRLGGARSVLRDVLRTGAGVLATLVSAACAAPAGATRPEATPVVALKATTTPDAGPTASDAVHLTVIEATGVPTDLMARVYLAAREPLQTCRQAGGGKVNVRITKEGGFFHLSVEPGASLDPSARHCVLEALSTVDLEETGGNVGGPTVRPSGFTSLITVSW